MKILLIGGTGTISMAITNQLAKTRHQLTLLNRGKSTKEIPENVEQIHGNIHDEVAIAKLLHGRKFDVVANFIAFGLEDVQRDYRLFKDITNQYVFISSASAYQKPSVNPVITESTPLVNPHWEYSRNKIACEEWLLERFRQDHFPITIVRPSHTYSEHSVPVGVKGDGGSWALMERMLAGKPVIIHGDGSSLWTMTYNSDFAKGFIGLLGNVHAIGQAVHITSDESLSWLQIHEIIARKLGVKLNPYFIASDYLISAGKKYGYDFEGPLTGDKAVTVIFDNSKLKKLVPDFVATKRFDIGVSETIDHILANPELQIGYEKYDQFCDEIIAALEEAKMKFLG